MTSIPSYEIRRLHPALQQLRTIKFHYPDNEAIVAYSKFDPSPVTRY